MFPVSLTLSGVFRRFYVKGTASLRATALAAGMMGMLVVLMTVLTPGTAQAAESKPSAREIRNFQIKWQSALLDSRAGRFKRAAQTLQALDVKNSLTRIYRASFLAETYLANGQPLRAAHTLDEILWAPPGKNNTRNPNTLNPVWLRHLYRLRLHAYDVKASPAAQREFLSGALRVSLDESTRTRILYQLLDLDTLTLPSQERPPLMRQLVAASFSNPKLDSLYRKVSASFPPKGLPKNSCSPAEWEEQKLMLDFEEKLGLWQKAIQRGEPLVDNLATPELSKALQLKIAQWYYNAGSYKESIKRYDAWRERWGDTPDALIQSARAYRNLSMEGRAQTVYSQLIDQFPKDLRSAEVIWMRTFDAEMTGRMEDAIEGYSRVIEDFPRHARGSEAMFRIGLTYFKRGDLEAAQKAFRDLRNTQKRGKWVGAARYWEGKVLARRGDEAAARGVWKDLAVAYPFGYYGHQAQRELTARGAWPDSLNWSRRFQEIPDENIRTWMMTTLPNRQEVPDGFGESPYLPLAKLLSLHMDSLAVLTLQSQVNAAPGNPWVLYTAATRAREAGFDYEAYRFGVKLADRLPLENWPNAPLSVLRLFYPPSYINIVRMEATRAGVAPSLVLALIKQESGFEPRAISRVGARGLMQMMPATGTIQARKEKMIDFDPDSLFVPSINTRLGIAYLRDVLKRYDGNAYYALAHYNAGPRALERWLPRMQGRPLDEAVEDIGYAETRDYVKRVLSNYWTYKELWN